jgi:hypothetical protein
MERTLGLFQKTFRTRNVLVLRKAQHGTILSFDNTRDTTQRTWSRLQAQMFLACSL